MSFFSSVGKALRIGAGALLSGIPVVGPALGTAVVSTIAKRPTAPAGVMTPFAPPALPGGGMAPINLSRAGLPAVPPTPRALPTGRGFLPDIGVPGPGVFSPTPPPAGYHLDKKTRTYFVKNRRMNPLNPRALRRATRRLVAFQKEVKRTEAALRKIAPRPRSRAVRHVATRYRHTSE